MSTVVEFIGLCVFTAQAVSGTFNDSMQATTRYRPWSTSTKRVVAIMPRVPYGLLGPSKDPRAITAELRNTRVSATIAAGAPGHFHAAPQFEQRTVSEASATPTGHPMPIITDAGVEPHTAMLMFRTDDNPVLSGWTPADRKQLQTGWEYVELRNSDRVSFVADAPNVRVDQVTPVPSPLLHLDNTPLLPRYREPYSGAAAVFTIPEGVLSACVRKNGRVDTTLTLETRHSLKIVAGTKSLTVADGAVVIAANLPFGYEDTAHGTSMGPSHLTVYCAMQGKALCQLVKSTPPGNECDPGDRYNKQPANAKQQFPDATASVDWSCSNSQWP